MQLGITARQERNCSARLRSLLYDYQVEQTTQYVGRGRGAVHREKRVIEKTRYHITPTVCPEVIPFLTSACGYNSSQIEQLVAR